MSKEIKYYWGEEELRIAPGIRIERSLKWWYAIELFISLGLAILFLLQSQIINTVWVKEVTFGGSICLALVAVYRYISRRYAQEEMFVKDTELVIAHKCPFYTKVEHYNYDEMSPLHYIGKDARTAHPLKGFSYDYFGIDSNDTLLQSLYHSGNLIFQYRDEPVRFGKGIYSWHAEELVRMIQLYSGHQIRLGAEWKEIMEEPEWESWDRPQ